VAPKIIDDKSTDQINLLEGKTALLTCVAEGYPPPNIWWLWNGKKILGKNHTLIIPQITRQQMGTYICIAKNGIPPAKSKRIEVQVNCKLFSYHYNY